MIQKDNRRCVITMVLLCLLAIPAASNGLAQDKSRLDVSPVEQAKTQTVSLDAMVIERKKYSIVVRSGDQEYEVNIPNGIQIVLKMNRPLIDFQKKTVSVARVGSSPLTRKVYPVDGPLHAVATFAHEQQYQRIMKSDVKRLGEYTLSSEPAGDKINPTDSNKSLAGELLPGSSLREPLLKTDKQQYKVILGSGGRLAGQTVLSLEPGSTFVKLVCETDGAKWTAREIEFWPVTPTDAVSESNK